MSEMVERVARALFHWQHGHDRWDEAEPEEREDACEAARAAIETLREPPDEALKAAARIWDDDWCTETNALNMWNAMIDEALR